MPILSTQMKVGVISASVGIALIGALAVCFRRRRRRPALYKDLTPPSEAEIQHAALQASNRIPGGMRRRNQGQSSEDLLLRKTSSPLPPSVSQISHSLSNSRISIAKSDDMTIIVEADQPEFTPEQHCDRGLEALQTAISHWERALEKLDQIEAEDMVDAATENMHDQIHELLHRSYRMQEMFEQRLFRQVSTSAAIDAALGEMNRAYEEKKRRSLMSLDTLESSDQESFVSALEVADLSDLEEQIETFQHLTLYEAALTELSQGSVPCRNLRTKMVNCESDTEFLAKLHCIRLALQDLFSDETIRSWFIQLGREMISDLLTKTDRDPMDFQAAYDSMISFIGCEENWPIIEEELRGRGVKMLTFYDVVIDFMLFDAFDDLASPPSSVTTVVQNRWLSNGFKETALSTAVWSVLKAKRRMLAHSQGFIAHFYGITEHISPVLAWGFLGPAGELKDLCHFFRDQVLEFMSQVFSFEEVRYSCVKELASDILQLTRERQNKMAVVLSS